MLPDLEIEAWNRVVRRGSLVSYQRDPALEGEKDMLPRCVWQGFHIRGRSRSCRAILKLAPLPVTGLNGFWHRSVEQRFFICHVKLV